MRERNLLLGTGFAQQEFFGTFAGFIIIIYATGFGIAEAVIFSVDFIPALIGCEQESPIPSPGSGLTFFQGYEGI